MIRSYIYRLFDAIVRYYRKSRFCYEIQCPHKDFKLVGKITVINHNVKLGRGVVIYPDVMFYGDGLIEIGEGTTIGNQTIIYSSRKGGVKIGEYTQIAAQGYIIDTDHGIALGKKITGQENTVAPVVIGNDCWLAANVTVLKGSVIEDGAIVGAKGLVKGHIPQNAIAVGVPAKIVKYRE